MTTTTPPDDLALTAQLPSAPVPGGAVAAVLGALSLAACNTVVALTPGQGDVESTADLLDVARDQARWFEVAIGLGLLAAPLLVPGIWATAARLAPRAPWLAAAGAWLMGTGYLFSLVLGVEGTMVLAVSRAGGDPGACVSALDTHTPVTALAMYVLFGLGALVGTLVVGIAALRQRGAVPAWAGWALVASPVVRVLGLALGVALGPPVASLLIVAGFVGIWRGRRRGATPA